MLIDVRACQGRGEGSRVWGLAEWQGNLTQVNIYSVIWIGAALVFPYEGRMRRCDLFPLRRVWGTLFTHTHTLARAFPLSKHKFPAGTEVQRGWKRGTEGSLCS